MIDLTAWSCAHTTQLTVVQSKRMVCESGKSLLTHLVIEHLSITFLQHHRCMYFLNCFLFRYVSTDLSTGTTAYWMKVTLPKQMYELILLLTTSCQAQWSQ